jgi:hypothetical protein
MKSSRGEDQRHHSSRYPRAEPPASGLCCRRGLEPRQDKRRAWRILSTGVLAGLMKSHRVIVKTCAATASRGRDGNSVTVKRYKLLWSPDDGVFQVHT